jgi:signal transduction histidine kinase
LLEKIMDGVVELVGAERGLLLLYPEQGERRLQAKVLHHMPEGGEFDDTHAARMSIIGRVESEKAPLLVSGTFPEDVRNEEASGTQGSIKSVICVPVTVKGEMLGVIYLDNNLVNGLFSEEDLDVVGILAGQAGVSIQNARMYSSLKGYLEEIERSRDEIAEWNKKLEQRVEERTEEINRKNIELAGAVAQLKENTRMVEELAVSRERNRFALDAHDHLGHTLTLLIKLIEDSRMTCLDSPGKMETKLVEAARIAREGLDELRSSVKGLASEKISGNKLANALEELAEDFSALGTHVEFSVSGNQDSLDPAYYNTLYSLCVEASTNALRHGKAKNISIILKRDKERIRLVILDDGCGCRGFVKGFGLAGMEKRVLALNGNIQFNSDGENGFIIHAEIPCGEEVQL